MVILDLIINGGNMRLKKYLFLVLIAIFLSGCSKEYNLTITDDEFIEEVNVTLLDNVDNKKIVDNDYYPLHANTEETYEKKIDSNDGYLKLNLKYRYKKEDFANANSVNQCFNERKIFLNDEEYYYLELKEMTDCVSDFNFDINIITNNKVISNNADEVNNNKYTWHLSEDNKDNFKLKIKIAKAVYSNNGLTNSKVISYVILGLIGIAIIIFIGVTIKYVKNKNKI